MFRNTRTRQAVGIGVGLALASGLGIGILSGVSAHATTTASLPVVLSTPGETIPASVREGLTRQPSSVDLSNMHFVGRAGSAQLWIASGTKQSDVCIVAHFASGTEWIDGSTCYPAARLNEKGAAPQWDTLFGSARIALVPDGFAAGAAASLGGTIVSANVVALAPAVETTGVIVQSATGATLTFG